LGLFWELFYREKMEANKMKNKKEILIQVKQSYLDNLTQLFLNAYMGSGGMDMLHKRIEEIIYAFCIDHGIKIEIDYD